MATGEGVALGVAKIDVERIANNLIQQTLSWHLRNAGLTGLPGWSDSHGPYRFVPPKDYNPKAGPLRKTGGGYKDIDGNIWREGNCISNT